MQGKLTKEDRNNGWTDIEDKNAFEKFYQSDCISCRSTSCVVNGGWRNPCFIRLDVTNDLLTPTKPVSI